MEALEKSKDVYFLFSFLGAGKQITSSMDRLWPGGRKVKYVPRENNFKNRIQIFPCHLATNFQTDNRIF